MLNAWEQNAIFAPEYLKGLEATLMRVPDDDDDDVGDNDKIELYTTEEERTRHFSQLERYCRNNGKCSNLMIVVVVVVVLTVSIIKKCI